MSVMMSVENEVLQVVDPYDRFGWIQCNIGPYNIHAKVFPIPGDNGINNGRVSKIQIYFNG